MEHEKILITGGGGFLGQHLIKRYYENNQITVYSRDEAKHYYLKKRFPDIKCVIGDIRNHDLLMDSSKNHTIGIFAASLKQIDAVNENVSESVKVLIDGALNSRQAAEINKFRAACFISSDKSRAATTLYGAMKFIAGESFIINSEGSDTKLSTIIYGNVTNSTGSIIPLIWDAINNDYELTLYSETMTRFMISVEKAIDAIEIGLSTTGYNIIPKLKAFLVKDLFEIYKESFGLKYKIGNPRISEKIHETMITKEELPRTFYDEKNNAYRMHYKNIQKNHLVTEYKSSDVVIDKAKLSEILNQDNYYK